MVPYPLLKVFKIDLKGQPERLVGGPGRRDDGVQSLQQGRASGLTLLPLHSPALVPEYNSQSEEAGVKQGLIRNCGSGM
jgi:hypothetical protein